MRSAIPLASILLATVPAYAQYNLVKDYSGTDFFSGWGFYGNYDNLTNGDVTYLDQANATSQQLAYVNSAGNAIIKVDDTSFVAYNYKRNSVRVETTDYFPIGTVLVFDAVHLPFGCSVWPSFWTKGPNWPDGGEIDILEGVNLMTANQMAIHTSSGCTQSGTDCSASSGCTVTEQSANSYGAAFATAGGGVWATQFDTTGINIWFWSRSNVPSSISSTATTVDPTTWGTPSAQYSTSSCSIEQFFTPQQLVLDITLCGDWAGAADIYSQTCTGDGSATACYLDNVINNGTNYADAYFEISYIKAYSTSSTLLEASVSGSSTALVSATADASSPTGSTSSPSSGSTVGSTGNGSSTSTASAGNGAVVSKRTYIAAIAATVVSAFTWALI